MLNEYIYSFDEETAPDRESHYRRAYNDGFIAATEALEDLLHQGYPSQKILPRLLDHWDGPLDEWAGDDCAVLQLPPEVP